MLWKFEAYSYKGDLGKPHNKIYLKVKVTRDDILELTIATGPESLAGAGSTTILEYNLGKVYKIHKVAQIVMEEIESNNRLLPDGLFDELDDESE